MKVPGNSLELPDKLSFFVVSPPKGGEMGVYRTKKYPVPPRNGVFFTAESKTKEINSTFHGHILNNTTFHASNDIGKDNRNASSHKISGANSFSTDDSQFLFFEPRKPLSTVFPIPCLRD
ncbi:hypothetical protein VT99_10883 [Candidatus Electrothrix marina]|uniref:Uncharacterized protein n=1 Tax=Candidatus Electrothrix marina TaxID=1859130 RepID=A0A3S3UC81_9BACT|nr:hypothetical protein VT99_10883 [Candidatus Electrothrix marina]